MKHRKSSIHRKFHSLPKLRFKEIALTSFAGLILYQKLFKRIDLKSKLRQCFQHLKVNPTYGAPVVFLQLIIHVLLGFRQLRHQAYYQDDPMVKRVLGLTQLPDVSTVTRSLASLDARSIANLHNLLRQLVVNRLRHLALDSITLDFDGSVIGTNKHAEGSAIGFNRKKKGQRSYYPLFCTIAELGQVLDVLHRSGNVHDSNGAKTFILQCIQHVRQELPGTNIELRMDSAFFSDDIVTELDALDNVEYCISVPFSRFIELKGFIEKRQRWRTMNDRFKYFEKQWKPSSWSRRHRFIFFCQKVNRPLKGPLQLDLFEQLEVGHDYNVMVTNKIDTAEMVLDFHHGRGSQEGLFAELKSHNHLDYIPSKRWYGNQAYLLATLFAHNLNRELQMSGTDPQRKPSAKRAALWQFEKLNTQRQRLIQRAGRLIRPNGQLSLSMAANDAVKVEIVDCLVRLEKAA